MSRYTHLNKFERENALFSCSRQIYFFFGHNLNRSKSTISREIKRNSFNGEYWPDQAQSACAFCRKNCRPHCRFDSPALYSFVH